MTERFFAKPILESRFWIVEKQGHKVGTLCRQEDRKYLYTCDEGTKIFDNETQLRNNFDGEWMWGNSTISSPHIEPTEHLVYSFPCKFKPCNMVYDVKKKLPLFTKSKKSKSLYSAGYYIIRFEKGWVRSFCPKLITLERYPNKGPFKTTVEMKQELANANR